LCEQVAEQTALIEPLRKRIRELEACLAKDSHNSRIDIDPKRLSKASKGEKKPNN